MVDVAHTRSVIEEMRHRLLDLSGNNRLLNFKASATNCLRIVDELPDQLFEGLLAGKSFTFAPVPHPSENDVLRWHEQRYEAPRASLDPATLQPPKPEEWADHLGINVSFELPLDQGTDVPEHHSDSLIQTLLYPKQLETRLRKLRSDAGTAIEETGTNFLHLAFGFLNWNDGTTSKSKGSLAPLILVPVEIQQKRSTKGHYVYELSWSGEDLQPNLSLQKKLCDEFGLDLEDFKDDLRPEAYFRAVRDLVRGREGWLVRRFATLSLFQFGKLLIYRDLDPQSWPEGSEPAAHPVIGHITAGASGGGLSFEEPKPAESRALDLDLELVERADSSQADAIHAALGGTNLVIQGPPGTGKSQTITNLIAGALAADKTVLFVSEKLAALEVVRDRLDNLGLGNFVLELHSNKTRKAALIEDLRHRLEAGASFTQARDYASTAANLARQRDQAQAVHDALSQKVGAMEVPLSKAFFEAGRSRRSLNDLRAVGITVPFEEIDRLDRESVEQAKAVLADFAEAAHPVFDKGLTLADHPFAGLSSEKILGAPDRDEVLSFLAAWRQELEALVDGLVDLGEWLDVDTPPARSEVQAWTALHERREDVEVILDAIDRMGDLPDKLSSMFDLGQEPEPRRIAFAAAILDLASHRPSDLKHFDVGLLSDRSDDDRRRALCNALDATLQARQNLSTRIDLAAAFSKPNGRLQEIATILSRGGVFRWFKKSWRAARQDALSIGSASSSLEEIAQTLRAAETLRADEAKILSNEDLQRFVGPTGAGAIDSSRLILANLAEARAYAETVEAVFGRGLSKNARFTKSLLTMNASDAADLSAAAGTEEGKALRTVGRHLSDDPGRAAEEPALSLRSVALRAFGTSAVAANAVARLSREGLDQLFDRLGRIAGFSAAEQGYGRAFAERTGLDERYWSTEDHDLRKLASRAAKAQNKSHRLSEWLEIDRRLKRIEQPVAQAVLNRALEGHIPIRECDRYLDFAIMDGLSRLAISQSPTLQNLGQSEINALRRRYSETDERLMDLRAIEIAGKLAGRKIPEGRTGSRVADLTEFQLLRNEVGKKTRHVPIRQLVRRAGGALQALKPCFMMGPLSVAQYLQPGALTFDLVIFDEASQVRPEEALGALARGKQVVIVGDSKQLPPTDFFQRTGDAGEDAAIAAGAESILEIAEMRMPTRSLRWHYRSQHPDLIAFSNHEFYKGDLVLYPSPEQNSDDLGIRFEHVAEGAFHDGANPLEAEAVAKAVIQHLVNYPGDSLGVVAMNVKQRDLILEKLERMQSDGTENVDGAEALASLQERFFVKNLENVQGDERDSIIISMTYGPPSYGQRVSQSFGPINYDNGWRRLNVLFSRAKKRMHIVSSMRESDVTPGETTKRGPRALKSFLHFAETGRLNRTAIPNSTGRDPDSDFEVAVIEGLSAAGYGCVPQVGSSGFFIDIGIIDPLDPRRFLLGVECDGASYHSTLSARDRDRLRQEILEAKGWTIERVWSTDWFRDPDRELERLLKRIAEIRAAQNAPRKSSLERDDLKTKDEAANDDQMIDHVEGIPSKRLETAEQSFREPIEKAKPSFITQDEGRRLLIELRERIAAENPSYDRASSVLRKSMITELLTKKPTDETEFRRMIRPDLRAETKGTELKEHGDEIFEILERLYR